MANLMIAHKYQSITWINYYLLMSLMGKGKNEIILINIHNTKLFKLVYRVTRTIELVLGTNAKKGIHCLWGVVYHAI